MIVALDRLAEELESDPEFRLISRLWNAKIRYVLGEDSFMLTIADGAVASIVADPGLFDPYTFSISGPEEVWAEILSLVPAPMYQDLFPAQFHKGVRLEGDLESLYGYYAAVRRITDLLRQVNNAATAV